MIDTGRPPTTRRKIRLERQGKVCEYAFVFRDRYWLNLFDLPFRLRLNRDHMTSGGKDKRCSDGLYLILTKDAQKPGSLLHFDAFKQKNIDPLRIKRMVKITWYGSHDWGFLFWRCWCEARVFHRFCCTQVFKWNVAWSYTDLSNNLVKYRREYLPGGENPDLYFSTASRVSSFSSIESVHRWMPSRHCAMIGSTSCGK